MKTCTPKVTFLFGLAYHADGRFPFWGYRTVILGLFEIKWKSGLIGATYIVNHIYHRPTFLEARHPP